MPRKTRITTGEDRRLAQTEAEFQDAVIELAQWQKWLVAHFRPAWTARGWRTPVQADGKGFADLVMVHAERGQIIYAELKSQQAATSLDQIAWLEAVRQVETRIGLMVGAYTASTYRVGEQVASEPPPFRTFLWRPSDWPEVEIVLGGGE